MIVERHNGKLAVAPAQPRGSIFSVVLPACLLSFNSIELDHSLNLFGMTYPKTVSLSDSSSAAS